MFYFYEQINIISVNPDATAKKEIIVVDIEIQILVNYIQR